MYKQIQGSFQEKHLKLPGKRSVLRWGHRLLPLARLQRTYKRYKPSGSKLSITRTFSTRCQQFSRHTPHLAVVQNHQLPSLGCLFQGEAPLAQSQSAQGSLTSAPFDIWGMEVGWSEGNGPASSDQGIQQPPSVMTSKNGPRRNPEGGRGGDVKIAPS